MFYFLGKPCRVGDRLDIPGNTLAGPGLKRYLLSYDAGCRSCSRFKRAVDFLDLHDALEFMPLDQADGEGFLNGIPAELRHRSFHIVTPTGEVHSGAKAVPYLIRALPSGKHVSRLITSVPGGLRSVDFVYAVFSRRHDAGSCKNRSSLLHV